MGFREGDTTVVGLDLWSACLRLSWARDNGCEGVAPVWVARSLAVTSVGTPLGWWDEYPADSSEFRLPWLGTAALVRTGSALG